MLFESMPVLLKADFLEFSFAEHAKVDVAARPYHALSFRRSGSVEIETPRTHFISDAGTVTFLPGGLNYSTAVLEECDMCFVHFTTASELSHEPVLIKPGNSAHFKELFREGVEARNPLIQMSVCYRIIAELETELKAISARPPRRMTRAKEYLEDNICDPELRIGDAAAVAGVSEVYFRSEFKKYYDATPIEYIKSRRIEIAKGLLSTGICSISDVAVASGFDSISYFSQEFRRLVGTAPSKYIK